MFNDGMREDTTEREINKKIASIFFRNEKAIREKNQLGQVALGEYLGVTSMCISNWELGKNLPENLDDVIRKVADLFELDPGVLVQEDFAERYDPNAYSETATPSKKPDDRIPVYEIDGKYYTSKRDTDKDIAIRFLTDAMEESRRNMIKVSEEYRIYSEEFNSYKCALIALGVDVKTDEEEEEI